jgi:hypothetical protein
MASTSKQAPRWSVRRALSAVNASGPNRESGVPKGKRQRMGVKERIGGVDVEHRAAAVAVLPCKCGCCCMHELLVALRQSHDFQCLQPMHAQLQFHIGELRQGAGLRRLELRQVSTWLRRLEVLRGRLWRPLKRE